jgi:DNA-binding MarR family transcriptional regulator
LAKTVAMTVSSPQLRRKVANANASCVCFNIRRATRAVTQLYDDALRPSGLRVTQFSLLVILQGNSPLSISELAVHSGTDRTTLTRNAALLEEEGLVKIDSGADDARVRLVTLTTAGARALEDAYPRWVAVQDMLAKQVGSDVLARLLRDLSALSYRVPMLV